MELEQDNYTKQEVQTILQEQETKINELSTKITDYETQIASIPNLTKKSMENAIKVEMLKNGIGEDLFDLVSSEDIEVAKTKISKLVELNKKNKVDNSYKPGNHVNTDDEYSVAEKNGDTEGMLKNKLSKYFIF